MFCPNCKSEYREGFKFCKDCDIELVKELPKEENEEFEVVFFNLRIFGFEQKKRFFVNLNCQFVFLL